MNVDQTSSVNISLRVGSNTDVVTVTASQDLTDSSSSIVGRLISAATIDRVPLLTRNVYDLVQLSAGVTPANGSPNSSSSFAITNISSGRPGVDVSSYTINGAIEGSVYYMVDGSPLGEAKNNVASIIPALEIPEDAVDEFRVETQNTTASYQSGGAGVISLATKSGTNRFHGNGFVYIRPDVLAANDYFNKQSQLASDTANQSPSFHCYQEGGSIGDDYTLNADTVLQLRYSFTRHYEDQSGDPGQNGFDITSLGFPVALAAQESYNTLPSVLFSDVGGWVGGTANFNTSLYASENSDVNGLVTTVLGKHQISYGAEYLKRFPECRAAGRAFG